MIIERINAVLNISNFDLVFKMVFSPPGGALYTINHNDLSRLIFEVNRGKLTENECELLAGKSFDIKDFKKELHDMTKECLFVSKKELRVRRNKYKEWRKLVMANGQDVFASSLNPKLYKDYQQFIIPVQKSGIDSSFDGGYAENHCHYNVAGPSFYMNWLFLHNGVPFSAPLNRMKDEEKKKDFLKYYSEAEYNKLYNLCILAMYLRLFVYRSFNSRKKISLIDVSTLNISSASLEQMNQSYENLFFDEIKKIACSNHMRNKGVYDYCCDSNDKIQLFGERKLLSNCFAKYDKKSPQLQATLILYLIVRKYIESYFVQSNMWYGFNNFKRYERIFELFFPEAKYVKEKIDHWSSLYLLEDQKLAKIEVRLAPKKNFQKLRDRVVMCKESFGKRLSPQTGLILHFIKESRSFHYDKKRANNLTYPKSWKLIKLYGQQLNVIRKFANSRNRRLMKLVGIDAANEEIRCRPEIFAPFYRAIRSLNLGIGQTFHVGEDFTSLVDGLRAIYEAVHYLNLKDGNRIGHGSALATDIDKYYLLKGKQVISTKQDALDDFCFIYNIVQSNADYEVLCSKLKLEAKSLLEDIYGFVNFDAYISSLEMRGDHPDVYAIHPVVNTYAKQLLKWKAKRKLYYINNAPSAQYSSAWDSSDSLEYIFDYHFLHNVRRKGNETYIYRVDEATKSAIKYVQDSLAEIISSKKIGIETNPTSNYFIGPFVDFEDIPAISFIDGEMSKKDLLITVGTDDPGLFFTNLRNEYNSLIYHYVEEKGEKQRLIKKKMKELAQKSIDLSFIK